MTPDELRKWAEEDRKRMQAFEERALARKLSQTPTGLYIVDNFLMTKNERGLPVVVYRIDNPKDLALV